ncbi:MULTISPECIES: phytoene desaturase family protein [Rhodococcus]|uniref:Pyridine nucleotide-disulfide oxidoreductase domain-containing protein 2 n=1 Tax=Rhodococcus jostii TaxID=132919 RepID=A0ABU4C695_RHOJO|nr:MULTISPECIES: NAD(P)/FAD-dependent oxidoreductase [Rhodococcus]MDI9950559.1 NAD(P)/FAD-dependent oxidoreductase [Rhodococcus sp. IEGM 1305]MDV6278927.1 NAD(P)/FAD-dependent oxidoreductase [Rhodococcus jostii]
MTVRTVDAVVIGAGPNGLAATATLAEAGWDVVLLEQQPEPGGAVRSAELFPGFRTDLFSAFYPLAAVSPAIRHLDLEGVGLRWSQAPAAVGHPRHPHDDDAPLIHRDAADTAADLERRQPGDGQAWLRLFEQWKDVKEPFLDTLFSPFPPVRGPRRLLSQLGTAEALRLLRFLMLPARRMTHELFDGESARVLLLGNAMHADTPVDAPGSGVMGYLLTMLAQDDGYVVPVGGAGALSAAMAERARRNGAEIRCGEEVTSIEATGGVATEVRTAGGDRYLVRRAVLADVSAPALYGRLLDSSAVHAGVRADLEKFEWDTPVVKVNYALDRKIPWRSRSLESAGTVHLGADDNGLVRWMADLTTGVIPTHPFLLFGQMTTSDPSRSPEGTESAWAYTHLPRGITDDESAELLGHRVDAMLESHAPGFAERVVGRNVQRPSDLEASNANLHGGAVNGGTAQLYQQLVFRPTPGSSGPYTSIDRLYLASSATHPGGGVHGMCGYNAARAALADHGRWGLVRRKVRGRILDLVVTPDGKRSPHRR